MFDNMQSFFESTAGQAVTVGVIVLLFATIFFIERKKGFGTKALVTCAILTTLAVVCGMFTLFSMPFGGSVTLFSMLPIVLAAYLMGLRAGLVVGFAVGLISLIFGPYIIHPLQLLIDYPFAYGALAIGYGFRKFKYGLFPAYLIGVLGRYVMAVLSGTIYFSEYAPEGFSGLTWALYYNITYLGAEAAITLPLIFILYKTKLISNFESQFKLKR